MCGIVVQWEGRVLFLDLAMIRLGQLILSELKLAGSPPVEKWILRKASDDPEPILLNVADGRTVQSGRRERGAIK